jgi:hypothetical protein
MESRDILKEHIARTATLTDEQFEHFITASLGVTRETLSRLYAEKRYLLFTEKLYSGYGCY